MRSLFSFVLVSAVFILLVSLTHTATGASEGDDNLKPLNIYDLGFYQKKHYEQMARTADARYIMTSSILCSILTFMFLTFGCAFALIYNFRSNVCIDAKFLESQIDQMKSEIHTYEQKAKLLGLESEEQREKLVLNVDELEKMKIDDEKKIKEMHEKIEAIKKAGHAQFIIEQAKLNQKIVGRLHKKKAPKPSNPPPK